jgi:hypothetical protein
VRPAGPARVEPADVLLRHADPDAWTAEQTDDYLREYNNWQLRVLAVHEALPGHYLQLWHANRAAGWSRTRCGTGHSPKAGPSTPSSSCSRPA